MFGRPRCREWTPLTTQQLRLRSLIQIVGYNIRPPECEHPCSYYITLHHTTMSAPFYTSERILSPHPKWKEIDPEITQRMSSTNVVIRIWCHIHLPHEEENPTQDTIIQTWGVYFSGLRYLGANLALNFNSDCFKSNTLVFQMHGGYFCSYSSLKLDIMPPENEESVSSGSSGKNINCFTFSVDKKMPSSPAYYKREYSKSQSPIERGFKQNFPTMKSHSTLNLNRKEDIDPSHIFEHSPTNLEVKESEKEEEKVDLSETAESYDLRSETDAPRYRYIALNFLKSEIRHSYNANKLRNLHLLQYAIKKKQEAVQEVKEKIYKKSAITETDLNIKQKSRVQKNIFCEEESAPIRESAKNGMKEEKPSGPRLTLKLNDLLSYKSKPSPFQRAEHIRLTRQLEILHFKRLILSEERDAKLANIRRLKERHAKLFEENQDVGSELMENYHALSRCSEGYKDIKASCMSMRELARASHAALSARRASLLHQLHQIFTIAQKDTSTWTICDVPLPVCGDENPTSNPLPDAVATGYVAQAACLAAIILNQPLRYKITLLGSASKILDVTDLPDPNIPLFARGGDITLFRYGIFLLNKCVAQLLWGRGLSVYDMRPTLSNLQRLMTTPSDLSDTSRLFSTYRWLADHHCPKTQSLRSVATERGRYRQFNRFKDSVDGQSPQRALSSRRHKHSRSVGSYHDDQELGDMNVSTTSMIGSDSNIYNMKHSETKPEYQKTLSDSEIANQTDRGEEKVIFTLGDDMDAESSHLVRISTNNDDKTKDNVKRICSEITTYCTEHVIEDMKEINEFMTNFDKCKEICADFNAFFEASTSQGDIDIAKYMEKKASVDIEDVSCDDCERNVDGVCDLACANTVKDVIVIQSAEAKLDTGQDME
ncbi:UV radiation resistance-associated gene protein isoform X2 [Aricia agestis]|uniref:UV radiation resistance-associated gene protein isoform X1 n=1 Tax=Aricia agestis TaxID=91739 RepID=UPI001C20C03C|nr:UV radiation resistance-associated gene protein isoform X1 [Aricia agestis]XP_041985810.1 UV radiation resistance-associated gene protein isoform X2 [Aricia agestis]